MKKLVAVLAALVASSSMAITGNQAVQTFIGTEHRETMLMIYSMAFMDQEVVVRINAKAAILAGKDFVSPFCAPEGANSAQLASIISNELRSHPENNHQVFAFIARQAATKAWPCTEDQVANFPSK
jgi:hypothetical protein